MPAEPKSPFIVAILAVVVWIIAVAVNALIKPVFENDRRVAWAVTLLGMGIWLYIVRSDIGLTAFMTAVSRAMSASSFVKAIGIGAIVGLILGSVIGGVWAWYRSRGEFDAALPEAAPAAQASAAAPGRPPIVRNPEPATPASSRSDPGGAKDAPSAVEDVHDLVSNNKLLRGWTLHKRRDKWSLYLMMNTDLLPRAVSEVLDASELSLDTDQDLIEGVATLWRDVRSRVPEPLAVQTHYGVVKDQEVVEHMSRDGRNRMQLVWTYEVFSQGRNITPAPQVHRILGIYDLEAGSRNVIDELDTLAARNVNRRYIDATVKVSQ